MAPPSLNLLDSAEKVFNDEPRSELVPKGTEQDAASVRQRKANGTLTKYYTAKEVLQHDKEDDCWLIVNGSVYNVTKWIPRHPGWPRSSSRFASYVSVTK